MRATLLILIAASVGLQSAAQHWNRTYDMDVVSNVAGSIQPMGNGDFFSVKWIRRVDYAGLCAFRVNQVGDTLWTNCFRDSTKLYSTGLSGSVVQLSNDDFLFAGATIGDSLGVQSLLIRYTPDGDTLWSLTMGGVGFENLNQVWEDPTGKLNGIGAHSDGSTHSMFRWVVDPSATTDTVHYYAQPGSSSCMSGRRTQDGGYLLSGSNTPQGGNSQLALLKTDSAGNLLWSKDYGSPWGDNVAFVEEMPNGHLIMAGAVRLQAAGALLGGYLAELEPNGDTIWTKTYLGVSPIWYSRPVVLPDGFAVSGGDFQGSIEVGVLLRTDLQGNELWRRTYQTNTVRDHYFYDVRPTLDGGFIMAGSAFDSLVTSQDAWLVKVDSFGCLVPGCQGVGIIEQVTDMGEVLRVWPNPVGSGETLQVEVLLPECRGCRLSIVSATGKLVQEHELPLHSSHFSVQPSALPPGVYFLHLSDGTRWLAGTKVVVE